MGVDSLSISGQARDGGPGRPAGSARRGLLVLLGAWLLLLALVGGALGYAFLTYEATLPEPEVTPPPRFEESPVPAPEPLADDMPAPETRSESASAGAETGRQSAADGGRPAPTGAGAEQAAGEAAGGADGDQEAGQDRSAAEAPAVGGAPEPGATQQAALPRPPEAPPPPPVEPAWQRFAMPYAGATNLPRIAVVVGGLGLHDQLTQQAIEQLPPGITLSFSPYARGVETWLAQARAKGHEVMLDLPMEPESFPNSDPGHFGLFVSSSAEENLERLREVLARGSAYVGVAGVMGSRFTQDPEALRPILAALGDRGLLFLDNRATDASEATRLAREMGVPSLYSDRTLDGEFVQANAIDSRLAQVERLARTKGVAVAMANVYPTTFRQLRRWADSLNEKGLALAPVTAVLGRQPPPQ